MIQPHVIIGAVLFALACEVQPLVATDPTVHLLVQFPLLGGAGFMLGRQMSLPPTWTGPVVVFGIATVLFWMLPRSLDGTLTDWTLHIAKFVTLPLAGGLPLAVVWPRLHFIVRGVIKAEAVSMLGILGFLYTHAPIRICNSYLISDQITLGFNFFWAAAALAVVWSLPVFLGPTFVWRLPKSRTFLNDIS
jgi:hypothetical protein